MVRQLSCSPPEHCFSLMILHVLKGWDGTSRYLNQFVAKGDFCSGE